MQTQLTLTQEIEINDGLDKFLLEEILLIVQNSDILALVSYWGHQKLKIDEADEQFFKRVFLSINALIKANALKRNYGRIENILINEIEKDPSIKKSNIDILFNKVDALVLAEGFFSQIKSALDLLAQSLKPIFGIEFHTWERKKELSGQRIVDALSNNLNKDLKQHALPLINLINIHSKYLTKIIIHRDSSIHYGKLTKVQGFRYSVSHKKVIPPLILINKGESAYLHDYLNEVLKYIADFIQEFIITLLSNLLPDMKIAKRIDNTWGWVTNGVKRKK